jgi:hypothetical protein
VCMCEHTQALFDSWPRAQRDSWGDRPCVAGATPLRVCLCEDVCACVCMCKHTQALFDSWPFAQRDSWGERPCVAGATPLRVCLCEDVCVCVCVRVYVQAHTGPLRQLATCAA